MILTELMYTKSLADKNQLSYNQVVEIALDVSNGLQFLYTQQA